MSPRLLILLCALIWAACALTTASAGADAASWKFEPATAPPPPPGVTPPAYRVALGEVGDIEFWAPNRGLLITGGSPNGSPVPAGVYAYDGVSWHQLSTVCGGSEGKIVWAGPDEFWTISDERSFVLGGGAGEFHNLSLCHFLNGQVVGSYAEPFNQPSSYQKMFAGACLHPDDCWFGGALGQPPNHGAFHLHWDGQNVTVVYSEQEHAVASIANTGGDTLLESVQLEEGDSLAGEPPQPYVFHEIEVPGSGMVFNNQVLHEEREEEIEEAGVMHRVHISVNLPDYGADESGLPVSPLTLGPFLLSSDYSLSEPSRPPQVWALATKSSNAPPVSSDGSAHTIILHYSQGEWSQVVGGEGEGGDASSRVGDAGEPFQSDEEPLLIAAEPSGAAAWITIASNDGEAHLARLAANGAITRQERLGTAQGLGKLGDAGPITCPAVNDCWLATSQGWLFHLTDGATWPQDTDPDFAGVISYRPSDPAVPQLPPEEPPVDDSLANQQIPPPPPPEQKPAPKLVNLPVTLDVHSRLIGRYTLELTFKLAAKAHVQLLATRRGHIVAKTPLKTMKAGKHKLDVRLDPRRWPTKIELKAKPLHPLRGPAPSGGNGNGPISENSVGT